MRRHQKDTTMVQLRLLRFVLVCCSASLLLCEICAFTHPYQALGRRIELTARREREQGNANDSTKDDAAAVDPLTKVPWYAVEAFGKIFGSDSRKAAGDEAADGMLRRLPTSVQETQDRIKQDNDRAYFLSGTMDELIYSQDCTFADPFVSFRGRDRFVDNLSNLGSFITAYSARPLSYNVDPENGSVTTKFMVKLELNLPWKPVLAWPWGVRCEIDPQTNLIVLHEESWDIEPWEGVKQIFRKPTTSIKE